VVTFPPGQATATVAVTIQGDTLVENNETFTLKLDDAVNAFLARDTATGTIISDEAPPPMGWNGWNHFGCNIDENLIRQNADAIVTNNLKDLGYAYVNLDDCWMAPTRDAGDGCRLTRPAFPQESRRSRTTSMLVD
jgi:alpha-galactosidase